MSASVIRMQPREPGRKVEHDREPAGHAVRAFTVLPLERDPLAHGAAVRVRSGVELAAIVVEEHDARSLRGHADARDLSNVHVGERFARGVRQRLPGLVGVELADARSLLAVAPRAGRGRHAPALFVHDQAPSARGADVETEEEAHLTPAWRRTPAAPRG